MKKLSILLIFALTAFQGKTTEKIDFGPFSISAPEDWKVIKVQGIDSYVRMIKAGNDTLHFDYGYYSNPLEEDLPRVQSLKYLDWFIENEIDTSGMVFIDKDTVLQEDVLKLSKQKVIYDTIAGFSAKIVTPKVIGNGMTGVYFDSLGVGGVGKIKLNLVGFNLPKETHDELIKAIYTIDFKNK